MSLAKRSFAEFILSEAEGLRTSLRKAEVLFMFPALNVTILTGYSFQSSSNKERIDLYNPQTSLAKPSYFTACLTPVEHA
jgi:hypothetical protein